jgi:hypothetical protein
MANTQEDTAEPSTGQANQQSSEASDTGDPIDGKALAEKAQAEIEQWKALARKHEDRAKRNFEAAAKVKEAESKAKSVGRAARRAAQGDGEPRCGGHTAQRPAGGGAGSGETRRDRPERQRHDRPV